MNQEHQTVRVEDLGLHHYQADIPPEALALLDADQQTNWQIVPALSPLRERIARKEIKNNLVDAQEVMAPFLDDPIFIQTLRVMDVLDGCDRQCDTCYIAAVVPHTMFSFESLQRLFNDPRFTQMLQPDSLRFGSAGDLLDHPQALDIVKLALETTSVIDKQRQEKEGKRHTIKVFNNFRQKDGTTLLKLLELAETEPRLQVVISLPLNRNPQALEQFRMFVTQNYDIFNNSGVLREDDKVHSTRFGIHRNIITNVVSEASNFHPLGRIIHSTFTGMSEYSSSMVKPGYHDRGSVKVFLNPNGLWLQMYTSSEESSTNKAFKLFTPENYHHLSKLPYHPHFPNPPHWLGGQMKIDYWESRRKEKEGLHKKQKPVFLID